MWKRAERRAWLALQLRVLAALAACSVGAALHPWALRSPGAYLFLLGAALTGWLVLLSTVAHLGLLRLTPLRECRPDLLPLLSRVLVPALALCLLVVAVWASKLLPGVGTVAGLPQPGSSSWGERVTWALFSLHPLHGLGHEEGLGRWLPWSWVLAWGAVSAALGVCLLGRRALAARGLLQLALGLEQRWPGVSWCLWPRLWASDERDTRWRGAKLLLGPHAIELLRANALAAWDFRLSRLLARLPKLAPSLIASELDRLERDAVQPGFQDGGTAVALLSWLALFTEAKRCGLDAERDTWPSQASLARWQAAWLARATDEEDLEAGFEAALELALAVERWNGAGAVAAEHQRWLRGLLERNGRSLSRALASVTPGDEPASLARLRGWLGEAAARRLLALLEDPPGEEVASSSPSPGSASARIRARLASCSAVPPPTRGRASPTEEVAPSLRWIPGRSLGLSLPLLALCAPVLLASAVVAGALEQARLEPSVAQPAFQALRRTAAPALAGPFWPAAGLSLRLERTGLVAFDHRRHLYGLRAVPFADASRSLAAADLRADGAWMVAGLSRGGVVDRVHALAVDGSEPAAQLRFEPFDGCGGRFLGVERTDSGLVAVCAVHDAPDRMLVGRYVEATREWGRCGEPLALAEGEERVHLVRAPVEGRWILGTQAGLFALGESERGCSLTALFGGRAAELAGTQDGTVARFLDGEHGVRIVRVGSGLATTVLMDASVDLGEGSRFDLYDVALAGGRIWIAGERLGGASGRRSFVACYHPVDRRWRVWAFDLRQRAKLATGGDHVCALVGARLHCDSGQETLQGAWSAADEVLDLAGGAGGMAWLDGTGRAQLVRSSRRFLDGSFAGGAGDLGAVDFLATSSTGSPWLGAGRWLSRLEPRDHGWSGWQLPAAPRCVLEEPDGSSVGLADGSFVTVGASVERTILPLASASVRRCFAWRGARAQVVERVDGLRWLRRVDARGAALPPWFEPAQVGSDVELRDVLPGSDGVLALLDVAEGTRNRVAVQHASRASWELRSLPPALDAAPLRDGLLLLSRDGALCHWLPGGGACAEWLPPTGASAAPRSLTEVEAVASHPEGAWFLVAAAGRRTLWLLRRRRGHHRWTLVADLPHDARLLDMKGTREGRLLLTTDTNVSSCEAWGCRSVRPVWQLDDALTPGDGPDEPAALRGLLRYGWRLPLALDAGCAELPSGSKLAADRPPVLALGLLWNQEEDGLRARPAWLPHGLLSVDPFDPRGGFPEDHRLAIAPDEDGGILLLTGSGLVPLDDAGRARGLARSWPTRDADALAWGARPGGVDPEVLVGREGAWSSLTGEPIDEWVIAAGGASWRRTPSGTWEVRDQLSRGGGEALPAREVLALGLPSQRLLDAQLRGGRLVAATRAGVVEIDGSAAGPVLLPGTTLPSPPVVESPEGIRWSWDAPGKRWLGVQRARTMGGAQRLLPLRGAELPSDRPAELSWDGSWLHLVGENGVLSIDTTGGGTASSFVTHADLEVVPGRPQGLPTVLTDGVACWTWREGGTGWVPVEGGCEASRDVAWILGAEPRRGAPALEQEGTLAVTWSGQEGPALEVYALDAATGEGGYRPLELDRWGWSLDRPRRLFAHEDSLVLASSSWLQLGSPDDLELDGLTLIALEGDDAWERVVSMRAERGEGGVVGLLFEGVAARPEEETRTVGPLTLRRRWQPQLERASAPLLGHWLVWDLARFVPGRGLVRVRGLRDRQGVERPWSEGAHRFADEQVSDLLAADEGIVAATEAGLVPWSWPLDRGDGVVLVPVREPPSDDRMDSGDEGTVALWGGRLYWLEEGEETFVSLGDTQGDPPVLVDLRTGRAGLGATVEDGGQHRFALGTTLYTHPRVVPPAALPFDPALLARCSLRRGKGRTWYGWCPDDGSPIVTRQR